MKGSIQIQDEYIETLNAGIARWAHRPKLTYRVGGGHATRIERGARHKAERDLRKVGFNENQIKDVLKDAWEMAALIRNAEEE